SLKQAEYGHRHRRLSDVLPVPLPAGGADVRAIYERQPIEVDAEDQNEQEAHEEGGQGEADKRQRAGDLIEDRIGPHRRVDADRQRDQQGEDLRGADDEDRRRQPLQDQGIDVDSADEGEAPLAVQHGGEPAYIANGDGIIEPEFHAQGGTHLGRNVGTGGKLAERIAGGEREHREQHDADPDEAGDRDQEAPEKIAAHFSSTRREELRRQPALRGAARSRFAEPIAQVRHIVVPAGDLRAQRFGERLHLRPIDHRDHRIVGHQIVHANEQGGPLDRVELDLGGAKRLVVVVAAPARYVAALPLVLLVRD